MQDYKIRMIDEYKELNTKIKKLSNFISKKNCIKDIGFKQYYLLKKQLKYMKKYLKVLNERIGER